MEPTPIPSLPTNVPPPKPGGRRRWLPIVVTAVGVIVIWRLTQGPDGPDIDRGAKSESREQPKVRAEDQTIIANAVYLRLIDDESGHEPSVRVSRAIAGVARSKKLPVDEVRLALDRFASEIEADPNRSRDDKALAATLRGKPVASDAAAPAPASPLEPGTSRDWLLPLIDRINAAVREKRLDEANLAYEDARRLIDRNRDPERWGRIQLCGAVLRFEQGRTTEALALAEETLELRERILPANSAGIANALHNKGAYLLRLKRNEEAAAALDRAIRIYIEAYGHSDLAVADTASEIAHALSETDRLTEAENAAKLAIRIYHQSGEANAIKVGLTWDRLGFTLLLAERPGEAEEALRNAVTIYDTQPGVRAKDHADAVHRLGISLARQNRRKDALPYLKRSTEIAGRWFADDDPLFAVYFHNLGVWADAAGDDPGTIAAYEKALGILGRKLRRTGSQPAQLAQTKEFYEAYLERTGATANEIVRRVREAMDR